MDKFNESKTSAEKLYNTLFKMRESLSELANQARELADDAAEYGGEIARVVREQCINYLIPSLQKLVSDENTPGAIEPIIEFLDSCPLSFIREEPDAPQGPAPIAPNGAVLATPTGSDVPQNASYQMMKDEGPAGVAQPAEDLNFGEKTLKAYKMALKEKENYDKLFEGKLGEEEPLKEFNNLLTASGRAQHAIDKAQKVNQKALGKIDKVTKSWTADNASKWMRFLSNSSKNLVLKQARQAYAQQVIGNANQMGVNANIIDITLENSLKKNPELATAIADAFNNGQGSKSTSKNIDADKINAENIKNILKYMSSEEKQNIIKNNNVSEDLAGLEAAEAPSTTQAE